MLTETFICPGNLYQNIDDFSESTIMVKIFRTSSFFNYVVENGGVSTADVGSLYLSTKRLKKFLQAKRHSLEASH